jgi:hypothetical protein
MGAFVACGACLEASSFSAAGDCWDDWKLSRWALSPDEPVSDIQLLPRSALPGRSPLVEPTGSLREPTVAAARSLNLVYWH